FSLEVPEIADGTVKIMGVAREPGSRAKIAVSSSASDVDPVGACVGMRGSRVQAVVQELRGEKIDIVPWSPDPARYLYNALAPAECSKVIVDENNHSLEAIVPDDQLSLAIGRQGQNVRLAAKLMGWKIDVKSELRYAHLEDPAYLELLKVPGMTEAIADKIYEQGIKTPEQLAGMDPVELARGARIKREAAASLIKEAAKMPLAAQGEGQAAAGDEPAA
ncbi:MAG: transcription termination/antitermination protein NusA, partial [Dissulfurimicrobium sp.]